ncbi:MAG: hypothetical protein IH914_02440 [candidate division Zixibacteria bacterium]|nr:hypothetical protein [candidate division Zixibacteria bacterium]
MLNVWFFTADFTADKMRFSRYGVNSNYAPEKNPNIGALRPGKVESIQTFASDPST